MTQLFRSKWLNFLYSAPREIIESFWPKKLSLAELKFDLKSWVTGRIIIQLGKVSNWRMFESIELSKLSQFDSQCWFNLTLNVEPIILSMLSQLYSQCSVNLTLNVESIRLSTLSQFDSNILQLPTLPGRILIPQVTQLFMSKWLNFFLSLYHSLQT